MIKLKLTKSTLDDGYPTGPQSATTPTAPDTAVDPAAPDSSGPEFEFLTSESEHHVLFWFGDLNFRLVRIEREEVERRVNHEQFAELLTSHDELTIIRQLRDKPDQQFSRYADLFEGFQVRRGGGGQTLLTQATS